MTPATTSLSGRPVPPLVAARDHAAGPPAGARLWYVDALRVYVIVLVFVIHVLEPFNPWDEWHITDAGRSRVLGEVVVLMAPWIMPLVMLLAGVSAWYALPKRDNAAYARERTRRVLVPLVLGTLLLVPPQVWLERRFRGQFHGSLMEFYPRFFDGIYPTGNFSWHHLWFLAHLYGYSLLALPLFRFLQRDEGRAWLARLGRVASGHAGLAWLALPLVLERSLLWGLFPERHMLTSDWSNHALLFGAYVYGFVLAGSPTLRVAIDIQWRGALLVAVAGTSLLMLGTWHGVIPTRLPPPYSARYLAFWMLYAWCAWAWMIALLGIARRWLDRPSPRLHRTAPTAYAWYVVHQPVVVAVAYVVVAWDVPLVVKLSVLFIASAAGTVLATALGRRMVLELRAHRRGTLGDVR